MENSNAAAVESWLHNWLDGVNFKRPGADQSLGRDIAWKVAGRIADRGATDKGGIDGPWTENSTKEPPTGGYAGWKERKYGIADAPNVRTGQMLSQLSLYGRTTIDTQQITMIYGRNETADQFKTGAKFAASDTKKTDTQKAYYAHTGQSVHKIKRPFYEVDESDGAAVVELVHANISAYVTATNAANGY